MTPTDKHLVALNIVIAEKCGWQREPTPFVRGCVGISGKRNDFAWWHPDIPGCSFAPRDFVGSLDAMHEAEEVIVKAQAAWRDYESAIRDITLRDGRDGGGLYERLIRATALQRAEAFVAACGLTKRVKEIEEML